MVLTAPKPATVTTASALIESIAAQCSDQVYVYDLALQQSFGQETNASSRAPPLHLQTRPGAGLAILGRLSEQAGVVSVLTTPAGLLHLHPNLDALKLPTASPSTRVIVQVPNVTPLESSLSLSPTLASLNVILSSETSLPSVVISADAQEAADIAALSYLQTDSHVVHIFNHYSTSRENRKLATPNFSAAGVTLKGALIQAGYDFFSYSGPEEPETVIVALNGPTVQHAKSFLASSQTVGVVAVRLLRPWDAAALRTVIPASTKRIHVLEDVFDQGTSSFGVLHRDVLSTFATSGTRKPRIYGHVITPETLHTYLSSPLDFATFLDSIAQSPVPRPGHPDFIKKLFFLSTPGSLAPDLPSLIAKTLSTSTIEARLHNASDAFSKAGGITFTRVVIQPVPLPQSKNVPAVELPINLALPLGTPWTDAGADFAALLNPSLLKSHDHLLSHLKPKSTLLLPSTSWTPEELISNITPAALDLLTSRNVHVCIMDAKELAARFQTDSKTSLVDVISYLAFLRLYLGRSADADAVEKVAKSLFGVTISGVPLVDICRAAWEGLVEIELPSPVEPVEPVEPFSKPLAFDFNTITLGEEFVDDSAQPVVHKWYEAAKHLMFSEAYALPTRPTGNATFEQNPSLRPDQPTRTYLVTTTVNKRLTPMHYDRNVFHLEFDTTGTGLTYAIGEALAVHGWNDEQEVLDFCSWYGLDPNELVTIPVPAMFASDSAGANASELPKTHTRTVFQVLQQQIDIFGRPPKSFYGALAEHATSKEDRLTLLFIASAEGSSTLRKLAEDDTVTFADVLKQFKSARPPLSELVELVGEIKERHYSIASANAAVGDRVDLLVVTVNWQTPNGTSRFGQCTRYLNSLKPGQKVTVSIKPSVVKLPPDEMQPIIMAGLGTGAAPCRAIMQHRGLMKLQNKPVGPLLYYFGSRHRSEEYLYGEEVEAYMLDGVVSHAGLAFSRDGKQKVYIQHKMANDGELLASMLGKNTTGSKKGIFYLCGPTWPVPDVFEALSSALNKYDNMTKEEAGEYLESLKEDARYVLEVY